MSVSYASQRLSGNAVFASRGVTGMAPASLLPTGITTGAPTLGSPALTASFDAVTLVAQDITTGAPTLGSPALSASGGVVSVTVEEIVAAVLAALNATAIPVNVKQVNATPLAGVGSDADPWRAA